MASDETALAHPRGHRSVFRLTKSTVIRVVFLLELDAGGVWTVIRVEVVIAPVGEASVTESRPMVGAPGGRLFRGVLARRPCLPIR